MGEKDSLDCFDRFGIHLSSNRSTKRYCSKLVIDRVLATNKCAERRVDANMMRISARIHFDWVGYMLSGSNDRIHFFLSPISVALRVWVCVRQGMSNIGNFCDIVGSENEGPDRTLCLAFTFAFIAQWHSKRKFLLDMSCDIVNCIQKSLMRLRCPLITKMTGKNTTKESVPNRTIQSSQYVQCTQNIVSFYCQNNCRSSVVLRNILNRTEWVSATKLGPLKIVLCHFFQVIRPINKKNCPTPDFFNWKNLKTRSQRLIPLGRFPKKWSVYACACPAHSTKHVRPSSV